MVRLRRLASIKRFELLAVVIRIVLILVVSPEKHLDWFVPFLSAAAENPTLDPWTNWLQSGGSSLAFPYGFFMLAALSPVAIVGRLLNDSSASIVLGFTFLSIDLVIARLIQKNESVKNIHLAWLFSPLSIYVTYIFGQTDLLVGLMALLIVIQVIKNRWISLGLLLGIGATTKLSVLVLLPPILLFLAVNPRYRVFLRGFLISSSISILVFLIPFSASYGFRTMVFSSPEIRGLLNYRLSLGEDLEFLFVPFIYFGLLYAIWRLGRTTNVVLASVLVATLWMISLLAPSSIGWYVWSLPLVICQIPTRRMNLLAALCVLQISAIATELLSGSSNKVFLRSGSVFSWAQLDPALINALRTLTIVCGLVVVVSITRYWLKTGDRFLISRFPLSIGIAGDSGVGKDTLAKSVLDLLPSNSGQMICGDDYHRFDRQSTEWLSRTHLDPIMNNLGRFATDIRLARKRIGFSGFTYDHSIGRFSVLRDVPPPDLMVVNGLHSFYVGNSEDLYDLKVFISMDESLRQKLKIERDVLLRGRSASYVMESIRIRTPDSKSFIEPQCDLADIHVHYSSPSDDTRNLLGFRSTITFRNFVFIESLSQCFNSVLVVPHRLRQLERVGEVELVLEPCEVTSRQILSVLNIMEPSYTQVFPTKTQFPPGTLGLVTLIVLIGLLERRSVGNH